MTELMIDMLEADCISAYERIGMCQSRYSNIEKGKSNPTLEQATLLMKLLDVKVSIF